MTYLYIYLAISIPLAILAYACCVVAGDADDRDEAGWRKRL